MTSLTEVIQPEETGELTLPPVERLLVPHLLLVTVRLRDVKEHVVNMCPFQRPGHRCLKETAQCDNDGTKTRFGSRTIWIRIISSVLLILRTKAGYTHPTVLL